MIGCSTLLLESLIFFRLQFHCNPNIVHYGGSKTPGKMEVGHCFTIGKSDRFPSVVLTHVLLRFTEPMINMGTAKLDHWPDAWTAVTASGQRSAQFEDVILYVQANFPCDCIKLISLPLQYHRDGLRGTNTAGCQVPRQWSLVDRRRLRRRTTMYLKFNDAVHIWSTVDFCSFQ